MPMTFAETTTCRQWVLRVRTGLSPAKDGPPKNQCSTQELRYVKKIHIPLAKEFAKANIEQCKKHIHSKNASRANAADIQERKT